MRVHGIVTASTSNQYHMIGFCLATLLSSILDNRVVLAPTKAVRRFQIQLVA